MKSKPSRRWSPGTEKFYRGLLREQSRSGLSVRAFSEARGLSAWTLYTWRCRLGMTRSRTQPGSRAAEARQSPSRLVEVHVGAVSAAAERRGGLVLHVFGRHRIELPSDFAEDELRRLVRKRPSRALGTPLWRFAAERLLMA